MPTQIHEPSLIHRAKWAMPVSSRPVPNGAVLTHAGRIISVGPFSSVLRDSPPGTRVADHGETALVPALVNAHTHLELSALSGRIPFPQAGFREWIGSLFALRAGMSEDSIEEGLRWGEAELLSSGTGLCGDITNGGAISCSKFCRFAERRIFLELLGFNLSSVSAAIPSGLSILDNGNFAEQAYLEAGSNGAAISIVPHSVYSVSPQIISESKKWTRARGLPFSIHIAEHPEEIEFLNSGKGFCRELLETLGRWEPGWKPPGRTPVEYLDNLGALDSGTLLVHAVHMTDSDWALAAGKSCTVVFCPRSNKNLSSGRPQIEKTLSFGISAALGTDSLASNTDLNLFAEAEFVLENYPTINPERLIEMITINPARALGRKKEFGSLEPGTKAGMLAVSIQSDVDESILAEAVIQSGKEGAFKWVNPAQS